MTFKVSGCICRGTFVFLRQNRVRYASYFLLLLQAKKGIIDTKEKIMDKILRITEKSGAFRAFVADTGSLVRYAVKIHGAAPTAAAAFGRTITAAAIMGLDLKTKDESLSLQINGDGAVGGIVAVADMQGRVRGYIENPHADLPLRADNKLDVGGAVGNGHLTVVRSLGHNKPYVSRIELQTGEIAEDIAYYFSVSQQTPSVVALGVLVDVDYTVKNAGGYFIQLLPNADEQVISKLEANVYTLESVTDMLSRGLSAEQMARELLLGFDYTVLMEHIPQYCCNCSKTRMERALISLGKKELEAIIVEDGKAELNCQFCKKSYLFDKDELEKLLKEATD